MCARVTPMLLQRSPWPRDRPAYVKRSMPESSSDLVVIRVVLLAFPFVVRRCFQERDAGGVYEAHHSAAATGPHTSGLPPRGSKIGTVASSGDQLHLPRRDADAS